jgi:halogenation protein CepH
MAQPRYLEYDVIVVGGGPAGTTVATLVAKRGHRVLLLEKARFPRHQIGESLLPVTVHAIGKLLGVYQRIEAAGFVRKAGGTFLWGSSSDLWTVLWTDNPFLEKNGINYSYQVDRARFDEILLRNASECGVSVREEACVTELVRDDEKIVGVRWNEPDSGMHEARCQFVVDAAGHESKFFESAGRREYSEFFRNIAVYGYFRNGKRLPAPNDGNALSVAMPHGWLWYLPISAEMTSVGAVVAREHAGSIGADKEKALLGFIDQTPLIRDFLGDAERIKTGMYGAVRVRRDYSYCNDRFWTPGLVLIGDAACFIDPVTATGVHLATFSALLAARAINACLAEKQSEPAFYLNAFEERYRREFKAFYDFLLAFYDSHQERDSYFWKAHKVLAAVEPPQNAFGRLLAGAGTSLDQFFADRQGVGTLLNMYKDFYLHPSRGDKEFDVATALKHVTPKTLALATDNVKVRYEAEQIIWDSAGYETTLPPPGHTIRVSRDGLAWERQ